MSYEFTLLTASNELDPRLAISRVLEVIADARAISSTLGKEPKVWASFEVARSANHDSVLIEMHPASDEIFLSEIDHLSRLDSAPDLTWVRGIWIFTLSGNAEVALAKDFVRALSARQQTQLYDEESGFDLRLD